ncbi:hypothetical protein M407DRAFT_19581 [Tulasnella calospora MUT 4182]|uniref:Uncharacterized protein n=1 Tax=Tulasnella calospora MUT 4182 TaxID=1051891 RepID=A0A0C3MCG4_9AGAM|nr:hypothetical protein M407DRAFT_19581 [Tulasnella calospora MUT 4182]
MPRANNAANRKLRQNALCCSITFANTRYEFQLEEHHVVSLKNGVINDPTVVNFHVASIGNRYAESCDRRSRPVFILPGTCFTEWRKAKPRNARLELANNYDIFKSDHIAFPFYWDPQGRWLLIILAGFGQLLGHEDPTTTKPEDLDFTFIIINAQHSESKPQYTALARSLRDFTTALLRLQLDAHHAAIQSAKVVVPLVSAAAAHQSWL